MSQQQLFDSGASFITPEDNLPEVKMEPTWKSVLKDEFTKDYFIELRKFLISEKNNGAEIYPPGKKIFSAFDHTPFDHVKVVIIGQDPYHGPGQANGLCFSVADGIQQPPSLQNIFKEIKSDLSYDFPKSGNLEKWAEQGVLMLNAILTVRANQPASHREKGWEKFTDEVIRILSAKKSGLVFLLWGKFAQSKEVMIDTTKHYILKAAHPSPFSVTGFMGCKHFSRTNEILMRDGKKAVDWNLNG